MSQRKGCNSVNNQISVALRSISFGSIAIFGCLGVSIVANADGACVGLSADLSARNEVNAGFSVFGSRLIAVGRVDAIAAEFGVEILGFRVRPSAGDSLQVGDYAAVVDWSPRGSKERILEVRPLASRYVPGASEVFVKSSIAAVDASRGRVRLGSVLVDHSASQLRSRGALDVVGNVLAVRGTQPAPNGVVVSDCISFVGAEGSLGTGRADGSLGTGRTDGSLGTGKANGSLGTGGLNGSLGTGRADGSLGTGHLDGSLGTGRSAD